MLNSRINRKGIILAGGSGSRLHPITRATSKQLLPIYDKPMVYYPLSLLMLTGIREILLISTPADIGSFQRLLGDGGQLGLTIEYAVQPNPKGLAQAFTIGRDFLGESSCALALGDNLLYGDNLKQLLAKTCNRQTGATIFGYSVEMPKSFGVVEFDAVGRVISLEEKPDRPRSNYAVPGLYFYDNLVVDLAATLEPSARGELEITDLNRRYLERGQLHAEILDASFHWLDAGTAESLFNASQVVRSVERERGIKVGCIEEIAYRQQFIDAAQLQRLAQAIGNDYGRYLLEILNGPEAYASPALSAAAA